MAGFNRTVSRRRFLGSSACLAGGLGLSSYLSRTSTLAQEQITLNVFVHANHPFDKVKPIYEAKYPNVKLNMMEANDMAIFRATLAANGKGTPDILWPEIEAVQELGKTEALLDVTDLVEKHKPDLAPGKTAECFISKTGKYAAYPGDIATIGLYYRTDLWEQAGVAVPEDWTWEDFLEAAKEVKGKTGAASLYFPTTGDRDTAWNWTFVLFQLGGAITNADGTEVTLDDERGIAAMELAKKMYEADVAIDEIPFEENYFAAIAAGQVAAGPHAVWYRGFGIEPNVTDEQSGMGAWRVARLPRASADSVRTANLGGAAIASTMYTQHPDEVKNFMETALGSMEGAVACGAWGILPPYLPYLASDDWKNVRSDVFGDFAFNEVWTACVNEYPGTWFKQPVFAEALQEVGAAMIPMMEGSTEIGAGMKEVGDRIRELNKRYQ
jgi:lactose/L-arabinose transport system substrate-binding protein